MGRDVFSPLVAGNIREVALVAQKIIDDQYPSLVDSLLDRFVTTERLLIERGKRIGALLGVVSICFLSVHCHLKIISHKEAQKAQAGIPESAASCWLTQAHQSPLFVPIAPFCGLSFCLVLCLNSGILVPAPAAAISSRTLPINSVRTRARKAE